MYLNLAKSFPFRVKHNNNLIFFLTNKKFENAECRESRLIKSNLSIGFVKAHANIKINYIQTIYIKSQKFKSKNKAKTIII